MLFKHLIIKASTMINHSGWDLMRSEILSLTLLRSVKLIKLTAISAIAFLFSVSLYAAELQDISFNSVPGGKFQIKMEFDETPPEPTAYNIEKPARIAIDLPGVQSSLAQKKYTLSYGNAQSVVVLETPDRTRVVINLVELSPYITCLLYTSDAADE